MGHLHDHLLPRDLQSDNNAYEIYHLSLLWVDHRGLELHDAP